MRRVFGGSDLSRTLSALGFMPSSLAFDINPLIIVGTLWKPLNDFQICFYVKSHDHFYEKSSSRNGIPFDGGGLISLGVRCERREIFACVSFMNMSNGF